MLSAPAEDLRLRDGREVVLASARSEDEPATLEFLTNLSALSRQRRFFSAAVDLQAETHREMTGDDADRHCLLAWSESSGTQSTSGCRVNRAPR